MCNNQFISKICNVACTHDELLSYDYTSLLGLIASLDKKEFGLDKSFETYYDVNRIILAIEKCQLGQIDDTYLTYWALDYDMIINAELTEADYQNKSLKVYLRELLGDWLDSLANYTPEMIVPFDLDEFKKDFRLLDRLIKDNVAGLCSVELAQHGIKDEVEVLLVNDFEKYFISIHDFMDATHCNSEFKNVNYLSLQNRVKRLRSDGYNELALRYYPLFSGVK